MKHTPEEYARKLYDGHNVYGMSVGENSEYDWLRSGRETIHFLLCMVLMFFALPVVAFFDGNQGWWLWFVYPTGYGVMLIKEIYDYRKCHEYDLKTIKELKRLTKRSMTRVCIDQQQGQLSISTDGGGELTQCNADELEVI